ncbi:UDP-2,3-diacetamido-2,3-dideoxy-D-glucuronate 2-epimerase [subsurface metagenome]
MLISEKPDIVLVYGDTNSTLAGALTTAKLHISLAHIEAGLRSYNKKMPEEINRVLTDHCSDILFCPTETAVGNLRKEGFVDGVYWVGDVMYDAVLAFLPVAERKSNILNKLGLYEKSYRAKRYCLATIHRAENTDNSERLKRIFDALNSLAKDDNKIIVPLHPRTLKRMKEIKMEKLNPNLCIIEPVSYLDVLLLEKDAQLILTDSGGVQKEAFFLEVPCLTLREETEWVETVESGWNRLVGTDPQRIVTAAEEIICRKSKEQANRNAYGDGQAARKIVEICVNWLKRT